jgi:hypothetical protein
MLNPFNVGSKVQLTCKQKTFEVDAPAITHHISMGLAFGKLGPDQVMALVDRQSDRTCAPLFRVPIGSSIRQLCFGKRWPATRAVLLTRHVQLSLRYLQTILLLRDSAFKCEAISLRLMNVPEVG